MINETLTAMKGIAVGHARIPGVPTGCTVILPEGGAVAGVDVRGGAPGTLGTDSLHPLNLIDRIHAVFLTGGSAFGLSVAEGIRYYLKERNVGFQTDHGVVPIVCGAVIFDLGLNETDQVPEGALGYEACENASQAPMPDGRHGAGLGATVGKIHGMDRAMMGGIGSVHLQVPSGLQVGAVMVVNAFGDVMDPDQNRIIAGCREHPETLELTNTEFEMFDTLQINGFSTMESTVIGAVVTNAKLNKTQLTKVAQMAHDGLARTIRPSHTLFDGDTIFALSKGELEPVDPSVVGSLAANAVAQAIVKAAKTAGSHGKIPGLGDRFAPIS